MAKLPFEQYGALCRQALAYAVGFGAAHLTPELGETTLEGGASMAEALRQVRLLADWLADAIHEQKDPTGGKQLVQADVSATQPARPVADVCHANDFRSVRWYGTEYIFTPTQAACVRVLWDAWERGSPVVGQDLILETAGSTGARLRDVFDKGRHPAWETMIVSPRKGAFRLNAPP
jgi:hypothetical protein